MAPETTQASGAAVPEPETDWFRRADFAYALALFCAAAVVVALAVSGTGGILPGHGPLLAIFFFLYGLFTINTGYQQPGLGYVSFDRVSQVASILILGPVDAAWVNGLASLVFPWGRLREGSPIGRVATASLHNAGLMTLLVLVSGSVYQAFGGPVPLLRLDLQAIVTLPVLLIGMQVMNELMMWVFTMLRTPGTRWELQGFALGLEFGSGLTAVLLALVWNRMEPPVVILLFVVLSAGMLALKQFARMRLHLETLIDERTRVLREKTIELDRLATRDQLTGLHNRRYADGFLAARIEEFHRYDRGFSIALIDLDHFKRINDELSHHAGDMVLRRVARIFADRCRETDLVARYGGEEFLLCFPEASRATATQICEELRSTVERTDWSDVVPGLRVSISAGVAEINLGLERSSLLRAADMKLYQAKNSGRNLVVG